MNFQQAVTSVLTRYVDFKGRSARSEYWYWMLAYLAVYLVFTLLMVITRSTIFSMLFDLVALGVFLPSLGVGIRRLHDTDRSGWWILIGLVPLLGVILLIIWYASAGTPGDNKFGPNPLGGAGATATPTTSTFAS